MFRRGLVGALDSRVTGAFLNTVITLLEDAGNACAAFHDARVRAVATARVEVDDLWSFTYARQKNVPTAKTAPPRASDTWTWTAVAADSRRVISWFVGPRDPAAAEPFVLDLGSRVTTRFQLSADGLAA